MGDENERVVVINKALKTEPFVPSEDELRNGKLWEEWLQGIEREFRYFQVTSVQDKKDALIIYGGKEIARLENSLPNPTVVPNYAEQGEQLDAYTKLKWKLTDFYVKRKNSYHATYLFNKLRPEIIKGKPESTVAYAARVREQATDCEFGDNRDRRILEHLIQTVPRKELIKRAINKKWDLARFLTEAAELEAIDSQMSEMKDEEQSVAKVQYQRGSHKGPWKGKGDRKKKPGGRRGDHCTYCGLTGVHPPHKNCPAFGEKCHNCGGMNHFSKACTRPAVEKKGDESKNPKKNESKNPKKKQVKKAGEDVSSDDEFFDQAVKHLKVKRIKRNDANEKLIKIRVEDVDMWAEPDSGADVNIMDEHQFQALMNRSEKNLTLETSQVKLSTLQSKLPVKGEVKTIVRNETCGMNTRFVIVEGHINSPPLISKKTLETLGMMKIDPSGSLAEENELKIKKAQASPVYEEMIQRHKEVFSGIGEIRDKKNNKEFYAHFTMQPGVAPVAQKPRPIAYYLQEPLKKWLDQCVAQGIYEEVPMGDPITWCSPLVVQPKPRFKDKPKEELEPQMIRASIDLRVPNKYMERNRITQNPVVEDFAHKFHDCKYFSKLDMTMGYHQLLLDPESRDVATFSTPWGNMRPRRLIFGAKASQDSFDDCMFRIFGHIPRCLNQRDDLLIGAPTKEEHDETLETVMQVAEDYGVTFSLEKCQFGVSEIDFYGYRFTADGLKPAEEKVRAIKECSAPEDKTAVRSFLGMAGYLSKFIPRYSSLTEPLRKVTHKDKPFKWGKEEQAAFEAIKEAISAETTMMYFDPALPIVVRTEASYHEGLSAGLFQKTSDGMRPVHFISRTMTETERRYSQTEKDALAVAWAKNRFRIYLLGAPHFQIMTAHKPLIPLFNKATMKLPPRIERWVMSMQDADYELVYEPGRDEADPLDFLSRHPLPETGQDSTEAVIKQVINMEHGIVLEKMQDETKKDSQLQKLRQTSTHDSWEKNKDDPQIAPFYSIRQQISTAEDLVFRLDKIIVPKSLRRKVVDAAHSMGHFGMTKTKQMLRDKYWFPELTRYTEEVVGQCYECQVTTKQHHQEPVKMTMIPKKAWEVVSIDFGGPYPDGHYNLVVIDKRTRYPEVEQTMSTAAKPTLEKLRKIFATHGIPGRVETDGGPPFNSSNFKEFAEEMGFQHHIVTADHARANGEAESFMKVLNKTEQIARLQKHDSKTAIANMLMGYRSTPHPATGVSPYKALMNRDVRTKLDKLQPDATDEVNSSMNEKDDKYKDKLKAYADKGSKEHKFVVGDYVLLKQVKANKWSTAYEPAFYVVYRIDGSSIAARRVTDGREVYRDASKFKLVNAVVQNQSTPERHLEQLEDSASADWREELFREQYGDSKSVEPGKSQETVTSAEAELRPPTSATSTESSADTSVVTAPEPSTPMSRDKPRTPARCEPRQRSSRRITRPKYLDDFVTRVCAQ